MHVDFRQIGFTLVGTSPTLLAMDLIITAALSEELNAAMDVCPDRKKIHRGGITLWTAVTRGGSTVFFLKTGIGPQRAAKRLHRATCTTSNNVQVLTVGYAGALDPSLRLGDLVVVRYATLISNQDSALPLAEASVSGRWELASSAPLLPLGVVAGRHITIGDCVTSWQVVGSPTDKAYLFSRFQSSIVDMETAGLAQAAASRGVPYQCVRTITDEATDTLLAPLSPSSSPTLTGRAIKMAAAGSWIHRYGQWKARAEQARESMSRFMKAYFEAIDAAELGS